MTRRGIAIASIVVILVTCIVALYAARLFWQRTAPVTQGVDWVPLETRIALTDSQLGAGVVATSMAETAEVVSAPLTPPVILPAQTLEALLAAAIPTATPTVQASSTPTITATSAAFVEATTEAAVEAGGSEYQVLGQVRHSSGDCPGSYVLGTVRDRNGTPLPDVRLSLTDDFGLQEWKATKAGETELGRYDFPLFGAGRSFYLTVVDASNRPLSVRLEIPHGMGANASATCHWVDWQRR